jgi:hypothetical protein
MSGIIGSRLNVKGSGLVAKLGTDGQILTSAGAGLQAAFEDVAGGITWQAVTTGSTLTAVAGNGYPINTTSNACTITLPASASNGDEIIFTDYARTWGTNSITLDSNGLNYQGDDDTFDVEYSTDGQSVNIVYSDATKGWIPISDDVVADVPSTENQTGVFGYGYASPSIVNMSNKVNSSGVIASDTTGVGTARWYIAATEYGGNKGIFGYGEISGTTVSSLSNLVTSAGVIGTDVTGVGQARVRLAGARYGGHETAIFGFGDSSAAGAYSAITNLVSSSGVIASDTSGVGTARKNVSACEFGGDKAIFGFGYDGAVVAMTNLVSNTGVVASDVSAVGGTMYGRAAVEYGGDKGIFAFGVNGAGAYTNTINLVSNLGVVASDSSGTGTVRVYIAACEYGSDKAVCGYGENGSAVDVSLSNLVSNAGVVATDTTGVGTARRALGACTLGG